MNKWKFELTSAEDTEDFGANLAENLKGGEILELISDLGGGKTTLTKGIAKGLGVEDNITSPTFVISKVYKGSSLELHHYDFYRLDEPGLMVEDLQDVLDNHKNITVVEWAGSSHDLFPSDRLVKIELRPLKDETSREIYVTSSGELDEVLEEIGGQKC